MCYDIESGRLDNALASAKSEEDYERMFQERKEQNPDQKGSNRVAGLRFIMERCAAEVPNTRACAQYHAIYGIRACTASR